MPSMFNISCEGLSVMISIIAVFISCKTSYHQTLSPPKFRWLTPMTYSLRDRLGCNRPAIAIAFNIHNSGARPGIIEDIAVRVIRQKPSREVAAFQAVAVGKDLRYVRVPEIEDNCAPMTPLVVNGRSTSTFIVKFEQRSTGAWTWSPGSYLVEVYEGNPDKGWQVKTSFNYVLPKEELPLSSNGSVQISTCQRWSKEVLTSRNVFCKLCLREPGDYCQ